LKLFTSNKIVIARLVRATHFLSAKLGRPHEAGDDDFFDSIQTKTL